MKGIVLTNGMVALVDDEDYDHLNQFKWGAVIKKHSCYANRSYSKEPGKHTTIMMHRQILGVTDIKIDVDHKDGNGLNNQRNNIRAATRSQNSANMKPHPNKTSRYKGVYWFKSRSIWSSLIKKDYKKHWLGYYETEEEAAIAYNKAAVELFGEFAQLNIIPDQYTLIKKQQRHEAI